MVVNAAGVSHAHNIGCQIPELRVCLNSLAVQGLSQSLLLAMSQFSFMVALVLSQKILAYTKGLSVKLQGRYVDVVRAHRDIESVKAVISGVRSRVDDFHSQVYEQVLTLSQSVNIAVCTTTGK